jgi:hypothetical protein
MSSIIFWEKINITTFESETHGATRLWHIVGLMGILKKKDIITGSVSHWAAKAGGSLSLLLIG